MNEVEFFSMYRSYVERYERAARLSDPKARDKEHNKISKELESFIQRSRGEFDRETFFSLLRDPITKSFGTRIQKARGFK